MIINKVLLFGWLKISFCKITFYRCLWEKVSTLNTLRR